MPWWGQTSLKKYRYYRCRRAYAGPRHDRCATRYLRAGDLEEAVVRELTAVLSSPQLVLAELKRWSASAHVKRDLAGARERLASLERQRERLLRLYQLGEIDDAHLQREIAALRTQGASKEATIERLSESGHSITIPDSPEDFAASCEALRGRVVSEVEEGRLNEIAEAVGCHYSIRPCRECRGGAKLHPTNPDGVLWSHTDPVDAVAAARAAQSGQAAGDAKTRNGAVEAIRALRVARRSASRGRTTAINQMRALLVSGPDDLRETLRGSTVLKLVTTAVRFRPADPTTAAGATRFALRELARRVQSLEAESKRLDALGVARLRHCSGARGFIRCGHRHRRRSPRLRRRQP